MKHDRTIFFQLQEINIEIRKKNFENTYSQFRILSQNFIFLEKSIKCSFSFKNTIFTWFYFQSNEVFTGQLCFPNITLRYTHRGLINEV